MPSAYQQPLVVGHRGAQGLAPENTLAGLEAAAAAGCGGVEVDVMLSSDGHAVLHHDLSLKRVAAANGRVRRTSQADLATHDVGSHFHARFRDQRIPTLEAALRRMLELGLSANLEIKPARGQERATAAEAVAVARRVWPGDRPPPLISSFKRASLDAARELAPELTRALIADRRPRDWRRVLLALDCAGLHLRRTAVAQETIETTHAAGYGLGIYTVNDPREARTFRAWGADCLITDRPDLLGRALADED